jgi:hypothetical protein
MGGFEGYERIDLTPIKWSRRYALRWCLEHPRKTWFLYYWRPWKLIRMFITGKPGKY